MYYTEQYNSNKVFNIENKKKRRKRKEERKKEKRKMKIITVY
jgi:hypothetical protein